MGDLEQAFDILHDSVEIEYNRAYQGRMQVNACFIHWLSSDLTGMGFAANQVLEEIVQPELQIETTSWSRYFMGIFHYERGNLVEAERYLLPNVIQPYQSYLLCFLNSATVLALVYLAQNKTDKAKEDRYKDVIYLIRNPQLEWVVYCKGVSSRSRVFGKVAYRKRSNGLSKMTLPF